MTNINFNGFNAQLNGKALKITKDGEERIYIIKEANNGIEYQDGKEYFFIRTTHNGFYYQCEFKNKTFVALKFQNKIGDKFPTSDEHMEIFDTFTFGEN